MCKLKLKLYLCIYKMDEIIRQLEYITQQY